MRKILFVFIFLISLSACDDDTRIPTEAGLVLFDNNCNDFVIETAGGTHLKPANLRTDFQLDQLQVIFGYDLTSDFQNCGFSGDYPIINVTTIRRR